MQKKLRRFVGPTLALVLFTLAIRLLWNEANKISWEEFVAGLTGVPATYIAIAAFLIALNYGLLICYDILALRYVCRPLPLRQISLVSFLGFTLGNNLGTLAAAAPIRYRFYHRFGLSHRQILAVMSVLALTFWSGTCILGGTVLVLVPVELPAKFDLPVGTRTLGAILLLVATVYALVCFVWHKPIPLGGLRLRPPPIGLAATQASVAMVDLVISATALYLVLPGDVPVPFATVLAAYLVAITVSIISQVPGGLGVLELILLTLLKDSVGDVVLASVLLFRVLYYVLPLMFGMVTLVAHEIYAGAVEIRADARDDSGESQVN
ncbi:MAG: UPF0104 family protein [Planctomycetota bacterium]